MCMMYMCFYIVHINKVTTKGQGIASFRSLEEMFIRIIVFFLILFLGTRILAEIVSIVNEDRFVC